MSDPQSANPFAAPQTMAPPAESALDVIADEALLEAAQRELLQSKTWIWLTSSFAIGSALFNLLYLLLLIAQTDDLLRPLTLLVPIAFNAVAALLLLRWIGTISTFAAHKRPGDVLAVCQAHLDFWRVVGSVFVGVLLLMLFALLAATVA